MPITLNIKKDTLYSLPWGRYRFKKELDGCVLYFVREGTDGDKQISEDEFVDMLDNGQAQQISDFQKAKMRRRVAAEKAEFGPEDDPFERTTEPQAANANAEFGPDADEADLVRARSLRFYVRKWDATAGCYGLGDIGLARLIALHSGGRDPDGRKWNDFPDLRQSYAVAAK